MPAETKPSHLKPLTYFESFESGELKGWASYPPNQDTAYDPYIYPGRILPGAAARCLVIKCEPLWNEDQTLGAVKLLDAFLDPASSIRFRYYLKSTVRGSELRVHLPLVDGRRLVCVRTEPVMNDWTEVRLTWEDLAGGGLLGKEESLLRLTALAITLEVPKADPDVPIYLGLDDIELRGLQEDKFEFSEPAAAILEEWPERIPLRHYLEGQVFKVTGRLGFSAEKVDLALSPFVGPASHVYEARLSRKDGGMWQTGEILLGPPRLPAGLYRGAVTARRGDDALSTTPFLLFIEEPGRNWAHPRVLFAATEVERFRSRFLSPGLKAVFDRFLARSQTYREQIRPERIVYDIDQFPDKDWVASLPAWYKDRFMAWREALFTNAVTYLSGRDDGAGPFIKALLLKLAGFSRWNHPWMEARGFHTYYPLGEFADAFALAYDVAYGLLSPDERRAVREGLLRNYVMPAFRTYVEQNQVTANSSNWISHIAGGGLVSLLAVAHDDPALGDLEPWLSGFLLKMRRYITTVFGADGSYGEGFRYYNFAMQSFARTLPALRRLFNIDLAGPLNGSHLETLWTSIVQRNLSFAFGDTESYLKQEAQAWWIGTENGPMNSWTWLLERTKDPTLAWLYRGLKEFDTLQEVLHDVSAVSSREPSTLGDVRFFPDVGTAVFRSGWQEDDFAFVFRSGPFFNHQHLDQGSFYLADRGEVFLEERYDGEHHYYDDPVYRSHAIQPLSHNTILVDRNPQSQRVGDPKGFPHGLDAQARLEGCLDARGAAFAAGDIGRLYKGKVRSLRRSVLYMRPRAVLIVDEAEPAATDVEIDLLFHTRWKRDIALAPDHAAFIKAKGTLFLYPVQPDDASLEVLPEPHFLHQYSAQPLVERGYLRVSAKTRGQRLVLAHFLTSVAPGELPPKVELTRSSAQGLLRFSGASGLWAVAAGAGGVAVGDWSCDGLLLAVGPDGRALAADARFIAWKGSRIVEAGRRFVGQAGLFPEGLDVRLRLEEPAALSLATRAKPRRVSVNGETKSEFRFDPAARCIGLELPAGVSDIQVRYEI